MERAKGPNRLRVLVAVECDLASVNGVTKSVLRSVAELQRSGHRVRIVAPGPGSGRMFPAGSERDDFDVRSVPSLGLPFYRSLRIARVGRRGIRSALESFSPDVVHLAAPVVFGGRVAQEANRLGIPTVAVFQTDLSGFVTNYRGLSALAEPIWRWVRRVHRRASLTLSPTGIVADELRRRGFEPVEVWGRGVDLDQFNPARRDPELRARWGADESTVVVGYVGRLAAEKRVERLAGLALRDDIRLVVVGDGPVRDRLTRALPGAGFTGMLTGDDLGGAVASLDLMIHTGEHETFCQAIQEAMAAGVAVVAPAAGGPTELIDHGVTGLLVPPGDDRALVDAAMGLVDDPCRRRAMGAAGHDLVQDRSWASLARQLALHYRAVIGLPPPPEGKAPDERMAA